MLKQYNGLYNTDYKIQVIQCNECHLERCLSGKCSISPQSLVAQFVMAKGDQVMASQVAMAESDRVMATVVVMGCVAKLTW